MNLVLKKNDSIHWKFKRKNKNNTVVDLTNYEVEVKAINKADNSVLFDFTNTDAEIITDNLNIGEFEVMILDTTLYPIGSYFVDITYTSPEDFIKSSKSFKLQILERVLNGGYC